MSISFDIVDQEYEGGRVSKIAPRLRITVTTHNGDPYNPFSDTEEADLLLSDLRDALAKLDRQD